MFYVAQENLEPLPPRHRRIHHPAIDAFFSRFDSGCGRFSPSAELGYEYPGSGCGNARRMSAKHLSATSALLEHTSSFASRLLSYLDALERKARAKGAGEWQASWMAVKPEGEVDAVPSRRSNHSPACSLPRVAMTELWTSSSLSGRSAGLALGATCCTTSLPSSNVFIA